MLCLSMPCVLQLQSEKDKLTSLKNEKKQLSKSLEQLQVIGRCSCCHAVLALIDCDVDP